jgi:hypothetical protein
MDWSNTNVQILKTEYIAGASIKRIASLLNRSPSAINKAITRFKITRKPYAKHILPPPIKPRHHTNNNNIPKITLPEIDEWVSIADIVGYLASSGFHISITNDCVITIGNKIYTPQQTIMIANKMRLENNELPYKVLDYTYEF